MLVFFLSQCISNTNKNDPRGKAYVGAAACQECHKDVYDHYITTAHFKATQPATKETVHGSFIQGQNSFSYTDSVTVVTEDRDSGLYQVLYEKGKEKKAYRLDIAFGLKLAQTYLYWKGNETYELPISYYQSVGSWATSPGFSPVKPNFNRFIGSDCFECHSSFIRKELNASTSGITEALDRESLINGIDCERCHGPAINHVNYHQAYPDVKKAKYIVTSASLSRQQKLDMCAVCHSGNDKVKKYARFDFHAGDTLDNFFYQQTTKQATTAFDVHGNQYQLLAASKCFLGSKTMTCSTCHNPHENAASNLKDYSDKCLSCHNSIHDSGIADVVMTKNEINTNCIDCHMPKLPSAAIAFNMQGSTKASTYLLRTHKIAVYATQDKKLQTFIQFFRKNKNA